ncbi:MAG: AMP-dependent synthetase [Acidobacteria bacterium]|nr:MAG: AMP-dependent synthetase [Acidobacteriota bacterium]
MDPYLVHHLLERAAAARPDAPFLVEADGTSSYGTIARAAHAVAAALHRGGVRRGDRVALLARNSRAYVSAYYGALRAGAAVVPLNTAAAEEDLVRVLADCSPRAVVAGPGFGSRLGRALGRLARRERPRLALVEEAEEAELPAGIAPLPLREVMEAREGPPDVPVIDLDLASIVYTSGSTGTPRGAMLRHLNLMSNTRSIVAYLGLRADDRVLAVLPFHYVYGKTLLNTHAAVGATVVIENRFMFPVTALETLERERCTGFAGVPSTFAVLLRRTDLARRELPHLRYVTQAGGPMSAALTRRLIEALPGKKIFVMYGATEASARLSYLDPAELPRKIGSVGKAIPNVELEVVREDGSAAAPGEIGEIVARGSNIFAGYWNDPEETARVFDARGRYRTGDLGYFDEEGFLYVTGRLRDMIKSGAHRISAREIEEAILEDESVVEAAVIGVPDEVLGEAIRAFVVFEDGAGPGAAAALRKRLAGRLPPYKLPAAIVACRELPKNEAGKIMKQRLRETAGGASPES